MDATKVAEAIKLIDTVLARVACSREDHRKLINAVDLISDASFEKLGDKE